MDRDGHAFISYARDDSAAVDAVQHALAETGVQVWRDTTNLRPGQDWRTTIRDAITREAFAFIAVFSSQSVARQKSYQREELTLAIEQFRLRRPDVPWLIPVRLDDCAIPDQDLGAGKSLASLQYVDLFGDGQAAALSRLVEAVLAILGGPGRQPQPAVDSGAPIWSHLASHIQGARGTVGGSLYLTATQLQFKPNRPEAFIGGRRWSVPLRDIRSVSIELSGGNVFKGGLRDRLRVDLANGSAELFVVDRINDVIREITGAVGQKPWMR